MASMWPQGSGWPQGWESDVTGLEAGDRRGEDEHDAEPAHRTRAEIAYSSHPPAPPGDEAITRSLGK